MSEQGNGQLPLAKRTVRNRVSSGLWEQIKTAYASGIGLREIARNMDSVRQIATEVLSGSEESVVQAERLHELAFELEESIGGFNLDGNRLAAKRPKRPARPGNGASQRALPGARPGRAARPDRGDRPASTEAD